MKAIRLGLVGAVGRGSQDLLAAERWFAVPDSRTW